MATIAPFGRFRAFDASGDPLNGGKLYTYEAGTTTPKATYTDAGGLTANANPVVMDSEGYADVWLGSGGYKFILKTSADATLWTQDDIGGDSENAFGGQVVDTATNLVITSAHKNAVINCTAALTLTLPDAASAKEGFYFSVKNTHASGAVTIDPDASELIDGAATLAIGAGQSALIICTGTAWRSLFFATVSATGDNTFSGSATFTGKVMTPDDGELTIATGAVTVTGAYHTIDTEADAASDDLDTINGGVSGMVLELRAANDARTVVLKHNTGNIYNPGGINLSLTTDKDTVRLRYDGGLSKWIVTAATAAQGALASSALQAGKGGLIGIQYFTSSGTYTATAGTNRVLVEVVGGGADGYGGGNGSGGGGGGGSRKLITSGFSGTTVTVGSRGSSGGTSSFGAHCSATGGAAATATAASSYGGAGSGGDLNINGGRGEGFRMQSGASSIGGFGGDGAFGYGVGGAPTTSGSGQNGQGYGAGGAGSTGSGAASQGTDGIVIVYEYA